MFRRSLVVLSSKKPTRTIVRDPRKKKRLPVASSNNALAPSRHEPESLPQQQHNTQRPAFAPSTENQQSVGSALGSYALAGFGMSIGFMFVGTLFGGF